MIPLWNHHLGTISWGCHKPRNKSERCANNTSPSPPPNQVWILPDFVSTCYSSQTTQITQPTSHWAWLFFKPSATWMHPSVPKSVNRTSCPAAFSDPNFGWDFRGLRAIDGANHVSRQWPPATWPQPPNPPGVQELEHRMLPQDLRQGCGTSWKKVWKKWQKLGGYRLRFLKKGWFFFGGGSNLSTKDSQLFQTTWKPKEQIEHSSPKGLFFFGGGVQKDVSTWKPTANNKKTIVLSTFEPITPSTCGSDGVQLHDQLCQRLVVLQAIEECDRTWSKKPTCQRYQKSEGSPQNPKYPNAKFSLYSHVVYWGSKLLKHFFLTKNTTLYNFDAYVPFDLRCLQRACTFDTIVAQIQTLQGVIRANSFTKCLSTWQARKRPKKLRSKPLGKHSMKSWWVDSL